MRSDAASSGKDGCHVTGANMAKILAFRPVALKREEMSAPEQRARSAEVILFPGVRYERWQEIEPAQRSFGRERDVLELAE